MLAPPWRTTQLKVPTDRNTNHAGDENRLVLDGRLFKLLFKPQLKVSCHSSHKTYVLNPDPMPTEYRGLWLRMESPPLAALEAQDRKEMGTA